MQQLSAAPHQQRPRSGVGAQTGAGHPARPAARSSFAAIPPRHPAGLGLRVAGAGTDECLARWPAAKIRRSGFLGGVVGQKTYDTGQNAVVDLNVDWKTIADDWQQIASVQGSNAADEGGAD